MIKCIKGDHNLHCQLNHHQHQPAASTSYLRFIHTRSRPCLKPFKLFKQINMRYTVLAFAVGATAAPLASYSSGVCPIGLYSNPQCCATDVLGVAALNCQNRKSLSFLLPSPGFKRTTLIDYCSGHHSHQRGSIYQRMRWYGSASQMLRHPSCKPGCPLPGCQS